MPKTMICLSWERDGVFKSVVFPMTEPYIHKDLTLSPSFVAMENGQLFTLHLTPHAPVILKHLSVYLTPNVKKEDTMMVNGFQTWTQSRELGNNDQMPQLRWFLKSILGPYGDYNIHQAPIRPGHFQSWTYTYFRRKGTSIFMVGSVDESFGYTVLDYDYSTGQLIAEKELVDLLVQEESFPIRLYIAEGTEEDLWNEYASMMPQYREPLEKCTGWTSWYYYYTGITQEILLDNLNALAKAKLPLDVFQIDDGYQRAIGDWLEVNEKFPVGMKAIAGKIKHAGYRPGLWLAPFICEEKSKLFHEHPEWVLKDEKGKPLKAGYNPGWSGYFYALDFYAPGFQDYLREVFQTVLDDWGYEMVKLDFLYAVALLPRQDKTRGQVMTEAMNFLRQVIGERWILGCGVPLGPSFGQVDYCRIGSDVAPYWEDSKLSLANYRERVSTVNSLMSTVGRWQLNGRLFLNDPDVFILRDQGNKLTEDQRYTLFLLNNLLGGLVFFSDHIGEYTEQQMSWLKSMFPVVTPKILAVKCEDLRYEIKCTIGAKEFHIYANLSDKGYTINTPCAYFATERGYIARKTDVEIGPYQTLCLYVIDQSKKEPFLLGATGHIFPGVQIGTFAADNDNVLIKLTEQASPETKVYIGVPPHLTYIKVNGRQYSAKLNNAGARYISINKAELK